ncbi:MAG: hypothetical protein GC154_16005 [bacterium]|nr:hypothetical protein [bacterium]
MIFASYSSFDLVLITAVPDSKSISREESARALFNDIAAFMRARNLVLLQERIFGSADTALEALEMRASAYGELSRVSPSPTWIEGAPAQGQGIAGVHLIAAPRLNCSLDQAVRHAGRCAGRRITGRDAEYLFLSDAGAGLPVAPRGRGQTARDTMALADEILRDEGWEFSDVKRTWFYLENILDWYSDFNRARNALFTQWGIMNGKALAEIPASTGIWGRNPKGHCCTLDLLAIRKIPGRPLEVKRMVNPMQNEATEYGSAFSRAISIRSPESRSIFVSGAASIDEHGESVHEGDFEAQARRTLLNIQVLLETEHAALSQIHQGTAFLKRAEDLAAFSRIATSMGLDFRSIVVTIADVCRDELLFEMDAALVLPGEA